MLPSRDQSNHMESRQGQVACTKMRNCVRPYSVQNVLRWRGARFRQKVDAGRWRCLPSAFWNARLLDEISLYSTQERALLGTDFVSEGPAGLPVEGSPVYYLKNRAWGFQALAACLCLRSATLQALASSFQIEQRWEHVGRAS